MADAESGKDSVIKAFKLRRERGRGYRQATSLTTRQVLLIESVRLRHAMNPLQPGTIGQAS